MKQIPFLKTIKWQNLNFRQHRNTMFKQKVLTFKNYQGKAG